MSPIDEARFKAAADAFLLACNSGEEAKKSAGQDLLNVLVDFWNTYESKAYRYKQTLFFAQPREPAAFGNAQKWRLGVYPENLVDDLDLDYD